MKGKGYILIKKCMILNNPLERFYKIILNEQIDQYIDNTTKTRH